jgi:hypothetical protein
MGKKIMTSLQCPSCGNYDFDPEKQCACGYQGINQIIMEPEDKYQKEPKEKELPTPDESGKHVLSEYPVIKESDSWIFTFSEMDNCICLGTPALQSFRLKLTLNDLEELLEFLYRKTGKEKTIRKLQFQVDEMPDLLDKVYRMIEEKKSKIPVKFEDKEMKEIADVINMKLKS